MTANVEALLPGTLVLLAEDHRAPDQPRRGVVVRKVTAVMGVGVTVEVCVGPCARQVHSTDCPTVGFSPDDLLLVPADATSDAGYVTTAVALLICLFGSLLLLGVLAAGQRGMCHLHHDQLRYCPGYSAGEGTAP